MDKADNQNLRNRLVALLQHLPGGGLLVAVILLVVLGYFGWTYYAAEHLDRALYSLRYENLAITPQPPWIKSNIAEAVYESCKLDRVILLEPRATATIAQAFETNKWVKATSRVSKAVGGKVRVELIYRRPVAMIYCESEVRELPSDAPRIKKGFFPIDEDGTMLPTEDFGEKDPWNYFMIFAEDARPGGEIGMPYGDVRITEAIELCGVLEPHRVSFDLQFITVNHDGLGAGPSPWILTIATRDRSREIIWGHAPGITDSGELPTEEKLNRMLAWLKENATPGASAEVKTIDLRQSRQGVPVSSRIGRN